MKIKFIPVLIFAIAFIALLTSEKIGPANYGYDATGAEGTGAVGTQGSSGIVGCSNGGNCHNATASLNTTVELDSAGIAVTGYHPGTVYTVKIMAVNNTTHTLPKFGFQLATVLASTGGTANASQAGTWSSTLPTDVEDATAANSGLNIPLIEHNTQITALSGSGGVGTVYADSVQWTAPVAGTGAIKIYGALNAVAGNDQNNQDYYQAATPVTIQEDTAVHTNVGINEIPGQLNSFNVYPTLMNDNVTVAFDLKEPASVNVSLISMQGQTVKTFMTESLGSGTVKKSFDVNGLASGIYFVRMQIGNASVVTKVVKE